MDDDFFPCRKNFHAKIFDFVKVHSAFLKRKSVDRKLRRVHRNNAEEMLKVANFASNLKSKNHEQIIFIADAFRIEPNSWTAETNFQRQI